MTQWADKGRIRGNVLIFFERPGRVRFDVMTQFGPAAVLTSDGQNFQLSDLRSNTFVQGPTCPANIARLLGVAIEGEDVLRLLTGDTPRIEGASQRLECRRGVYAATLGAEDGTTQEIELMVDPADRDRPTTDQRLLLHSSSLLDADGTLLWRASYSDYRVVDGISFPTDVRLTDYVSGADTQVRVKSLTVNPSVPSSAFAQTPRPGASIELATCP